MSKQLLFCGNCKDYLDEKLTKDSNESNGGPAFRIPSLVNADGTLVAAIDKASTGMDWGYIEIAVRTSNDNGKTWSDIKTIASPPAREISTDGDNIKTAFFIDPCMTVAPNGDIVMIVTFFPESKGCHSLKLLDKKKIAYTNYNGESCPVIYDRDGNYYIVLPDGTVLDSSKNKTEFTVKGLGELYKNDEYVGNIHLNGAIGKNNINSAKTTFGAPLKAPKRSYIYMLRSTDKGETWSEPKDITGSILNPDDGVFFAVAPGSGLTTSKGRIIMPIYTFKGTVAIYSDDNGETWQRMVICIHLVEQDCMARLLLLFHLIVVSFGIRARGQRLKHQDVKKIVLLWAIMFIFLIRQAKRELTA
jgi:Neuraminidase (sialidase)